MADGPWTKYQQAAPVASGPWAKYGTPQPVPAASSAPSEADLITDQAMAAFAAGDDAEGKRLLTEANRAAIAAGAVPEGFVADPRTGGFSDIQNDPSLDMGAIPSLGFGAMQGLGFNFGDEAIGKLEAVTGGDEQFAVERAREMDRRAQKNPWAYYGGYVPGAVASSLSLGKAIGGAGKAMGLGAATGSSLAGRAGLGAATGALEGGLAGFGAGEDGFGNRMASTGKMAALGAGIGGAAPLAMAGLGAVMKTPVNALASAFNVPSNVRASEAVAKMLRRAGMSADDAKRAIDQAAAEGQDVYKLVDALGLSGQRGLAGIARQPGDTARQEIAEFLTTRQAGQGDRLAGFVADALDAPDTAAARAAAMKTARDEAADLAYTAAREGAGPVDVRGALAVIDDRIGPMTGSGIADDGISGKLSRYRGRLAADDPAASVLKGETGIAGAGHNSAKTAVELSDFDRVLILKQEIGDDIGAAVRAGRNNEARELMKVQKALDEALEAASPGYRSANDEFAKASKAIGAVDAGEAAAGSRIRSEDTAAQFGGLADDGKSAFRAGYADPVIAKIDASAMGVNKARPLSGTKTAKDFDFLAKDPELIKRQIARENAMFETNVAALGGSKTADNLADAADMSSMSSSMIANFLTGNWGSAARQAADKVVSGATGMNPSTREIIAKALLSSNPAAALAPAAKRAAQLETPRKVIEALIRSGGIRLQ